MDVGKDRFERHIPCCSGGRNGWRYLATKREVSCPAFLDGVCWNTCAALKYDCSTALYSPRRKDASSTAQKDCNARAGPSRRHYSSTPFDRWRRTAELSLGRRSRPRIRSILSSPVFTRVCERCPW